MGKLTTEEVLEWVRNVKATDSVPDNMWEIIKGLKKLLAGDLFKPFPPLIIKK